MDILKPKLADLVAEHSCRQNPGPGTKEKKSIKPGEINCIPERSKSVVVR